MTTFPNHTVVDVKQLNNTIKSDVFWSQQVGSLSISGLFFLHLRLGSHPSNCDVEIPYDTDTSTFLQTTTVQNQRNFTKN